MSIRTLALSGALLATGLLAPVTAAQATVSVAVSVAFTLWEMSLQQHIPCPGARAGAAAQRTPRAAWLDACSPASRSPARSPTESACTRRCG